MRHSSHLHLHFHTHHRAARYDVDMTKGSITKHLINFALPLMVGNLFQQLYNMVDTWVVGNYVSNEAFSAVGTVTPIINTLIGFFLGLSSGAGVVISQYYGAGREDKVRQAVHTSLVLTLLMGAVFTAAGIAMTRFKPSPCLLRLFIAGHISQSLTEHHQQTLVFTAALACLAACQIHVSDIIIFHNSSPFPTASRKSFKAFAICFFTVS